MKRESAASSRLTHRTKSLVKKVRDTSREDLGVPLVSVAVIAYNVDSYIAETLESILDQVVDFQVEVLVGEDCSTDRTREIVLKYKAQYPDIIRVLEHPHNLGLTPNSVETQNACTGKYIALCDGDDFWTDENKLKRQIDFLQENENYSASGHQSHVIYNPKFNKEPHLFREEMDKDCDLGIAETIRHRKFHTSSLVYRREHWIKSGGIPKSISSNERAIYPMLAIYGKIRYFKDSMCVYRQGGSGLSSRISSEELGTDIAMIPWLKKLDTGFPIHQFRSFLHLCSFTYPEEVPLNKLIKHYAFFVLYSFSNFPKNFRDLKYGTSQFFSKL